MKFFYSIVLSLILMLGTNNFVLAEIDLSPYVIFSNLKSDSSFDYTLASTQSPVFLFSDVPTVFIKSVSRIASSEKVSMTLFVFDSLNSFSQSYSEVPVNKLPKVSEEYNNSHCDESASELEKNQARPLKWLEFNFRIF